LGILIGGRLVFNRIIPIAGERFTRAVERELHCDFESAEQLKIQHGLKYMERFRSAGAGPDAEGEQVSKALEQEVETLLKNRSQEADLLKLYQEEHDQLLKKRSELETQLEEKLLAGTDPDQDKNIIVEIRAGTGGEEASLFARDLFRMYSRHAAEDH
jgi:protein subunit release factor A